MTEFHPGEGPPARLAELRAAWLGGLVAALDRLAEPQRGLSLALLLGRQDELASDMQAVFYQSGCAHLVALSGMHVALVAMALMRLSSPLVGSIGGRLIGMGGALVFIWLVGPFPSAIRALLMFIIYQTASLLGYRVSLLSCLALTGPLLSLIEPRLSLDLGYLLSFWALFGILLVQSEWRNLLRSGLKPWLAGELAGGLSAQFATLPLLALRGLPLCLQGCLASLVLGPLSLLYLAASAGALLAVLVGPPGIGVADALLAWLYQAILMVGRLFAIA
jgi:competence protein ComEC